MKTLEIKRVYGPVKTEGVLTLDDVVIGSTLELPDRGNQRNISCIPEGTYDVHRDRHGKHTWFRIADVPNRTAIEIHEGYLPKHSQGCILMDVLGLQDLLLAVNGNSFKLKITS